MHITRIPASFFARLSRDSLFKGFSRTLPLRRETKSSWDEDFSSAHGRATKRGTPYETAKKDYCWS